MPRSGYALEPGGPKRLELSWGAFFSSKKFVVTLDGNVIAEAHSFSALKQGLSAELPDGSTLSITLKTGIAQNELEVLRDGRPLPGSPTDPQQLIKLAAGVVFLLAAVNFLLGVLGLIVESAFLEQFAGVGIVIGIIYAVCGLFTMRRSRIALGIAMALYFADGALTLTSVLEAHGSPGIGGIIVRVLLLLAMARGFKAIGELKAEAASASPVAGV